MASHAAEKTPLLPTSSDEDKPQGDGPPFTVPCRYILVLLLTTGFINAFSLRVAFNLSLVAMVNFTKISDVNSSAVICTHNTNLNQTATTETGEFNWSPAMQSAILGAFYYGYPVSQFPGGIIAERFGSRFLMVLIVFGSSVLNLLIPLMTHIGPIALIVTRALQGVCQGPIFPTLFTLLSQWIPPGQRVTMVCIVTSGDILGKVAGNAIGGVLAQSKVLNGWPLPFYTFGSLGILWTAAWLLFGYSTPASHPRISKQERKYIEKETEQVEKVEHTRPRWRSVFTSLPVLGIALNMFTDSCGGYVVYVSMPIYMKQVLGFDISQDGLINAMPYILQVPSIYLVGFGADYLRRKNIIKLINIRRLGVVIGECAPGICMIALGYSGCNQIVAIGMFAVSTTLNVFIQAGSGNPLFDVAPRYAGSIMGVINGLANIPGFIAPSMVAAITDNSSDQSKWRLLFFITAGMYMSGALVYCLLITDKEEEWAKEKRTSRDKSFNIQQQGNSEIIATN